MDGGFSSHDRKLVFMTVRELLRKPVPRSELLLHVDVVNEMDELLAIDRLPRKSLGVIMTALSDAMTPERREVVQTDYLRWFDALQQVRAIRDTPPSAPGPCASWTSWTWP